MNREEQTVVKKTTVTLSGAELLSLIKHGHVEDGNTVVQIPEKEWLTVAAE